MTKYKMIESMVPPGGWRFTETQSGVPIVIEGDNFQNLVKAVEKHRAANRYEVGNPYVEITDWFCTRYPNFCHHFHLGSPTPAAHNQPEVNRRNKIIMWTHTAARIPLEPSPSKVAERANACAQCPMNQNLRQALGITGAKCCGNANDDLTRALTLTRRHAEPPNKDQLGFCTAHEFDARTASVLERTGVPRSQSAPSFCWNIG